MNDEARAEVDRILAQGNASSTDEELGFLRARGSYLTEEQLINFAITEEDAKENVDANSPKFFRAKAPKPE